MAERDDTTKAKLRKIVEEKTRPIFLIMIGVVIVLFIGFASAFIAVGGLLQEYIATRSATYQDLVNKINQQSIKIDLLFDKIYQSNPESVKTE